MRSYLYSFITVPFMCLLYQSILSPVSISGKHSFTWLLLQNILSPVCPRKTSFDITDFPSKPEAPTSEKGPSCLLWSHNSNHGMHALAILQQTPFWHQKISAFNLAFSSTPELPLGTFQYPACMKRHHHRSPVVPFFLSHRTGCCLSSKGYQAIADFMFVFPKIWRSLLFPCYTCTERGRGDYIEAPGWGNDSSA